MVVGIVTETDLIFDIGIPMLLLPWIVILGFTAYQLFAKCFKPVITTINL